MALTPEGKVKATADKIIKASGCYSYKPTTGGFGKSGGFDQIIMVNGVGIGIEYKATPKEKPTALQDKNARAFMDSGGIALLINCDNMEVLEEAIIRRMNHEAIKSNWPNIIGEQDEKSI